MGNGKIIKLGFILLIIISLFISFGCQSAEDDVDLGYEVTVSRPSPCLVDITYSDSNGRIVQVLDRDIPNLPWDTSFTVSSDEVSGFLVFLTAQNCSNAVDGETITVTVRKDGLIFSTDSDDGASIVVFISVNL